MSRRPSIDRRRSTELGGYSWPSKARYYDYARGNAATASAATPLPISRRHSYDLNHSPVGSLAGGSSFDNAKWEGMWSRGLPAGQAFDKGRTSPALRQLLASGRVTVEGKRALVPGCGRGYDLVELARAGAVAVGLELAPSAVQCANDYVSRNLEQDLRDRATCMHGNFLALAEEVPSRPLTPAQPATQATLDSLTHSLASSPVPSVPHAGSSAGMTSSPPASASAPQQQPGLATLSESSSFTFPTTTCALEQATTLASTSSVVGRAARPAPGRRVAQDACDTCPSQHEDNAAGGPREDQQEAGAPPSAFYLAGRAADQKAGDLEFPAGFPGSFRVGYDYTFLSSLNPSARGKWAEAWARALAPGGVLVTLLYPLPPATTPGGLDAADDSFSSGPPYELGPAAYSELLTPAGFECMLSEPVPASNSLPGREGREHLMLWRRRSAIESDASDDDMLIMTSSGNVAMAE